MAATLPPQFVEELLAFLHANERDLTKEALFQEKKRLCKEHGIAKVPSDIELLTHLDAEQLHFASRFLLTKPVRSGSGVAVVAVMARPSRCPHGRCTFCPGGPGSAFGDVPQSYTGHEPASMRGQRAAYDAYLQVFSRLEQYVVSGHDPQKAEVIIMGGTFPHEDPAYQEAFVRDCYQALDDFSRAFYAADGTLDLIRFKEFFNLPGSVQDEARAEAIRQRILDLKATRTLPLEQAQEENETARVRCVGLTVETRPSHAKLTHANELLRFGCTRVELGVQTLYDDVLTAVHRGHTVHDTQEAIADLRDLGFKLNFHLMLGLPGMTRERDVEAARRLFDDPAYRPDMLKVYPCMVLKGTPLFDDYQAGRFTPLTTAEAADLIVEIKRTVPPWCRIMRIQRDIPTKVTAAGVDKTNLRQVVEERLRAQAITCRCIRCREIGRRKVQKAVLNVVGYEAAGGEEFFISIDDPVQDALIGFCRLRLPARQLRPEFDPRTAVVRELHVYGKAVGLGVVGIGESSQHKGYGSQLLHVAERIAQENGKRKLLVIAGVGVREYYRKLGYEREGPYMAKHL